MSQDAKPEEDQDEILKGIPELHIEPIRFQSANGDEYIGWQPNEQYLHHDLPAAADSMEVLADVTEEDWFGEASFGIHFVQKHLNISFPQQPDLNLPQACLEAAKQGDPFARGAISLAAGSASANEQFLRTGEEQDQSLSDTSPSLSNISLIGLSIPESISSNDKYLANWDVALPIIAWHDKHKYAEAVGRIMSLLLNAAENQSPATEGRVWDQCLDAASKGDIAMAQEVAATLYGVTSLLSTEDAEALSHPDTGTSWDEIMGVVESGWEQNPRTKSHPFQILSGYARQLMHLYYVRRELMLRKSRSKTAPDKPAKSTEYSLHTSQEWTELIQAVADGKRGRYYSNNEETLTRTHARPNAAFHTRLTLLPEEQEAGYGVDLLTSITARMDVDAAFALMYISHCLAPPAPLPFNFYAGGWIDLDDVARKISLTQPRSAAEAERNRKIVWDYLRFGARAEVVGKRTVPYYERTLGKEIDTRISTALWSIVSKQQPIQPALLDSDTIPVRVELVMSREWTQLTTSADTAQYLPLGEVLGGIPGGKPGGAWARSLGLAFVNFCRRHPSEALKGTLRQTREEWLSLFPPKVEPHQEVLGSKNPRRAITHWQNALAALVDAGILSRVGEAQDADMAEQDKNGEKLPRQGWQRRWQETPVLLIPGPKLESALRERAESLPPKKPKALSAQKRRGRPIKQSDSER